MVHDDVSIMIAVSLVGVAARTSEREKNVAAKHWPEKRTGENQKQNGLQNEKPCETKDTKVGNPNPVGDAMAEMERSSWHATNTFILYSFRLYWMSKSTQVCKYICIHTNITQ